MAWYRCGGGSSGGGGFTPEFSEELICNNDVLTDPIIFTEDYENYDFLRFEIYNTSSLVTTVIFTAPEVVKNIVTYSNNRINFNEWSSNQYGTYSPTTSYSWTRTNNRSLRIKRVYGINCTNGAVNKTVIYNKEEISSSTANNIESEVSYNTYDYIFIASSTGDTTETQPSIGFFSKDTSNLIDYTNENMYIPLAYNSYNSYSTMYIYDKVINNFYRAFYLLGVKITPN